MTKDKRNKKMTDTETDKEVEWANSGQNVDPDFNEEPPPPGETEADDDDFEFDLSLLPKNIKLVDLTPDFVRPIGFLMIPRINNKTGEIFPRTATFVGILNDIVPWRDNRGKERFWFSCTATASLPHVCYTGKNEDGTSYIKPVEKGDCIGISSSGAINALRTKKGHFIYLHWTGNKVEMKKGAMWEIKAKVSEEPIANIPF